MLKNKPTRVYHYFWLIFIIIIISSILLLSISESPFLSKKTYAHSIPISQIPSHDSILKKEELPSKVIIDFSERPIPAVSTIQVLNDKNERVDKGNFVIIGDHDREAMTTLDTKKLSDGVYTVSWMTQSADDGHIAKGSYVFGIGNVGQSSASSSVPTSPIMGLANDKTQYKVQAITSSLDGLIKWPLIISQITVIGVIFSHLFLWESFGKKIIIVNTNLGLTKLTNNTTVNNTTTNLRYNKRFSIILVIVSVTIIISANILLFLQITELAPNNDVSSYTSIFLSLLQGPSGFLWLVRITTSIVIIVSSVIYYYYLVKKMRKTKSKTSNNDQFQAEEKRYKVKKIENLFPLTLLAIAFVAGSMSILANSMTSHNAAVDFFPSLAVSLDWLHFMSISVWVGGLFYLSTVLLAAIKDKINGETEIEHISSQKIPTRTSNEIISINVKKRFIFNYYLALLLPRFSIVATISLGIIGISGIYMAWININNFNFLFNSEYGNILIIKLLTIIPLILLGGFHQLKLHNTIVKVASLGKKNKENINKNDNLNKNSRDIADENHKKDTIQQQQEEEENPERIIKSNKIDIFGKFNKTIKIESLVAIGVLLVASLLTVTSPPTTTASMNMPSMNEGSHTMGMPDGSVMTMNDMSMSNFKNNSYVKEVKILNVNTKIEINPFYSGFNTFKITFTDTNGQPYSKILTVRMIFKNDQADIGPITTKLSKVSPGVYAVRGGYISQPGEWNVAMAAQRPSDYDLNYKFNPTVNSSSSTSTTSSHPTQTSISSNNTDRIYNMNNTNSRFVPALDSFTLLAIILAVIIGITSYYFNKKSKEKLSKTIELLNQKDNNSFS